MGTQNTANNSISIQQANAEQSKLCFIDVRKPKARMASGLAIEGSEGRHPFDVLNWKEALRGKIVVVYCVHGHEVSQSVCGYLRDEGLDVRFLEGGFEAWREAGCAVEAFGEGQ